MAVGELINNPKAMKAIRKLIKLGVTAEAAGVLLAWRSYELGLIAPPAVPPQGSDAGRGGISTSS